MLPKPSLLESDRVRRTVVDFVRLLRELAFERDEHEPQLIIEAEEVDVVEAFGQAGYVHPWLLSFKYRGEDRNLARFFYDEDRSEYPYRQDHVRLYADEYPSGEVALAGHTEASSVTHRKAHLEREGEIGPAVRRIRGLLADAGLEYRVVTDDPARTGAPE